jgi:hypothetical protein
MPCAFEIDVQNQVKLLILRLNLRPATQDLVGDTGVSFGMHLEAVIQ